MKSSGITHLVIGILFIIVIVSVGVNYKLYNDCIGKINSSAKQSKVIGDKVTNFEMVLDGLKINVESLKADMQLTLEKSLQSAELKNEFSTKIEAIKTDLQALQVNYTAAVNDLNEKFNALKIEKDISKKAEEKQIAEKKAAEEKRAAEEKKAAEDKKVDLGEISVPTPD